MAKQGICLALECNIFYTSLKGIMKETIFFIPDKEIQSSDANP